MSGEWLRLLTFFAIGLLCSAASYMLHLQRVQPIPELAPGEAQQVLENFVATWDYHRNTHLPLSKVLEGVVMVGAGLLTLLLAQRLVKQDASGSVGFI